MFEQMAVNRQNMTRVLESLGHDLIRDEDGEVDWFSASDDESFHNGPVCKRCWRSWCEHCWRADDQQFKCE